ncbi:hypothetical protein DPEC_G00224500 [Dallia pectoralis]|uniref:Uncharacterized protein n=1 Tax=Dallia pectoralis TaxID=75939 RepID=A0ACC2G091_DALPE|nr:hypothetical protein DPEC_G00224500 [Dallia pectoralis]
MSTGIHHGSNQSIKPFKSSEEYLYAMKEDLAEWLGDLYDIDIDVNNIVESLETGATLCCHANNVTRVAGEFIQKYGSVRQVQLPTAGVTFVNTAQPATFLARDNVSNFITWCRKQMDIKDVLMFETDDLVLRKNEKNFVLCLLEVARRASRFGMAAPVLIQLEQEIDDEIREELEEQPLEETAPEDKPQRRTSNTQNLDEMVQHLISRCTCPTQFPMVKMSMGKYRVGDSSTLIFVRILRNHVMVRVGGGWDTLQHYLDKHDPCRCTSISHKFSQRSGTPVHEIKGRLPGRSDGQGHTMPPMLLLSRHAPTPLQPVLWAPSANAYTPGVSRTAWTRASLSPDRKASKESSPSRLRQSASTPTLHHHQSESKDELTHNSSTRPGRETTRSSPVPRQTSSLPRFNPRSSTPQSQSRAKPQPPRPKSPLVLHRSTGQQCSLPQPQPDIKLTQSWSKSQFASKLRQSSALGSNSTEGPSGTGPQRNGGLNTPRASLTVRSHSPASYIPVCQRTPTITIQPPNDTNSLQKRPDCISTIGPSRLDDRPFTPIGGNMRRDPRTSSTPYDVQAKPFNDYKNDFNQNRTRGLMRQSAYGIPVHDKASPKSIDVSFGEPGHPQLCGDVIGAGDGDRVIDTVHLFTPPPISPAQEACLYQSLEHEILSNLQQLCVDSVDVPGLQGDRKCEKNNMGYQPFENVLEKNRGGFTTVPADVCEQSPHASTSGFAHHGEAGFNPVISELPKGKRQLGKEVRSKECLADFATTLDPQNGVIHSIRQWGPEANTPSVDLRDTSVTGPVSLLKPWNSSFRQKGTLKYPDRVPSIYKLQIWPKVRPRCDYRPGKKPSRIPMPISYTGPYPADDPEESGKDTQTDGQLQTRQHETAEDHEESWV